MHDRHVVLADVGQDPGHVGPALVLAREPVVGEGERVVIGPGSDVPIGLGPGFNRPIIPPLSLAYVISTLSGLEAGVWPR